MPGRKPTCEKGWPSRATLRTSVQGGRVCREQHVLADVSVGLLCDAVRSSQARTVLCLMCPGVHDHLVQSGCSSELIDIDPRFGGRDVFSLKERLHADVVAMDPPFSWDAVAIRRPLGRVSAPLVLLVQPTMEKGALVCSGAQLIGEVEYCEDTADATLCPASIAEPECLAEAAPWFAYHPFSEGDITLFAFFLEAVRLEGPCPGSSRPRPQGSQ